MDFIEFDSELFAEVVATERIIKQKISQRVAAEEIGISPATLCRYELGTSIPDIVAYARICDWLDCEFDKFLKPKK